MSTFRFFDFPVYPQAKSLYLRILRLSKAVRNRSLEDQLNRAALSVMLNIAEGSAKRSDKEFAVYIQRSLGSVSEVVACLDIMREISYIDVALYMELLADYQSVARQLGGLVKKLYADSA